MKKIILSIIITIFSFSFVNAENSKNNFDLKIENTKNELKNTKYFKIIPELDNLINILKSNTLEIYLLKISKIENKIKNNDKKNIIEYIKLKINEELLLRENFLKNMDLSKEITNLDIDKIIKNNNINKIFIQESWGWCAEECLHKNYIFLDKYLISYDEYQFSYERKYSKREKIQIKWINWDLEKVLSNINYKKIKKIRLPKYCDACSDGIDTDIFIDYNWNNLNIDYDAIYYEFPEKINNLKIDLDTKNEIISILNFIRNNSNIYK